MTVKPSDDGTNVLGLNPHHRRGLGITLRMLEETLDRIEFLLGATPVSGVLYEVTNPYTMSEREEMRRRAAEARQVLRQCRERWGLEMEQTALDAVIRSEMSVLWADLEDCRPTKLRRYGDVPPSSAHEIHHVIENLIRLTQDFGRRMQ
jgi:hypothetical protein